MAQATPLYGTENFSTTLNVGGGINSSQTTGIVLTSVSGLNTNGGVLGLTWASTLDTSTYEEIIYTGVSGNELTGVTRGSAGTSGKAHNNGATVVSVVSSLHNNRIADKLRGVDEVLAQDPNANEIIETTYVASAVNEIQVSNAATGNPPAIAATGGDTNIDLKLAPKGSGAITVPTGTYETNVTADDDIPNKKYVDDRTNTDGWTTSSDTWTYASASTFTIAGVDRTTTFTKGTRLKFTQTTAKYAVVVASSFSTNTTVTIAVNTDYTIANAAISANYYSYEASPQGYPTQFNYTPTFTGFSADPATFVAKYAILGNLCTVIFRTLADGTSNAIGFTITAPVTAATVTDMFWQTPCLTRDNGTNFANGDIYIGSAGTAFTIEKDFTSANFTGSGGKGAYFTITYQF